MRLWIVLLVVGLTAVGNVFINRYFQKLAYENGRKSVKLEDLCFEVVDKGVGTDFTKGVSYDFFTCKYNPRDFREDWTTEGDWDRCDENGENCVPLARDGEWVEN